MLPSTWREKAKYVIFWERELLQFVHKLSVLIWEFYRFDQINTQVETHTKERQKFILISVRLQAHWLDVEMVCGTFSQHSCRIKGSMMFMCSDHFAALNKASAFMMDIRPGLLSLVQTDHMDWGDLWEPWDWWSFANMVTSEQDGFLVYFFPKQTLLYLVGIFDHYLLL